MDIKSFEAAEHVADYFRKNLPNFTVLGIVRKSLHPDDSYLYMIVSKKDDGSYAFWDCWNESTQSLNHGHYGIESLDACVKLVNERQDNTKYFAVYRYAQKAKERMFVTDKEEQARKFCEDNHWEWKDEHDFLWSLDYSEA